DRDAGLGRDPVDPGDADAVDEEQPLGGVEDALAGLGPAHGWNHNARSAKTLVMLSSLAARPASAQGAAVACLGTLLVAATYGMARFGVGLFAPRLVAERPDLAAVVGWAAAA